MIELVAFDLDGVLVDAEEIHHEVLSQVLFSVLGVTFTVEDDASMVGLSTNQKLSLLGVNDQALIDLVRSEKFKQLLPRLIEAKTAPNAFSVMRNLKSKGVKIAVVSNARYEYVRTLLDRMLVYLLVDVIVSGDCGLPNKPNPDMYLHACSSLGVDPKNTLVIEDSMVGVQAATTAGANVAVVDSIDTLTVDFLSAKL